MGDNPTPSPPPPASEGGGGTPGAGGPSPMTIGKKFLKQYYQVLSTTPDQIYRFYNKSASYLSHGEGSDPTSPVPFETYDIKERWGGEDRKKRFELEHGAIDAQPSVNGGILLVVTGHVVFLPKKDDSSASMEERRAFVHTFFLATFGDSKRFYVHNDVLRLLVEEKQRLELQNETGATPPQQPAATTTTTAAIEPADTSAVESSEAVESSQAPLEEISDKPAEVTKSLPRSAEPEPAVEESKEEPVDDDAPGGGVEESKEDPSDEDEAEVAVEEPKETEKEVPVAPETTKDKPKEAPSSSEGDASSKGDKGKKPKGSAGVAAGAGRGRSPTPKQAPAPTQPAPKPVPGSWASLVASGGGASASAIVASSPAKPPPPEKPTSEAKASDAKYATAASDKGGDVPSNGSGNASGNKSMGGGGGRDRPKRDPDLTLVIKNLADGTKESDVVAIFEPFAVQTKAKIVGATLSNHRGLAFVDYDSDAPVLAALEAHKNTPLKLNGRVLEVDQKTVEQRVRRNNMRGGGGAGGYNRSGSPGNGAGYNNRGGGGSSGGGGRQGQYRRGSNVGGRGGGAGGGRGGRGRG